MITTILVIIGLFLLFRQNVSLSNTSELRRPRTVIMGIITIAAGVLANVIARMVETQSKIDVVVYVAVLIIPLIIPLIAIPFLKQPKLQASGAPGAEVKTGSKAVNVIGWLVLTGVVGFLVWLMFNVK